MDQVVQNACADVVSDLIKQKKSFTAYDVTRAVRNAGHWAKHDHVRNYVHVRMRDEIKNGLYERGIDAVGPAGEKAFVYRPAKIDDNVNSDSKPDGNNLTISDLLDDNDD